MGIILGIILLLNIFLVIPNIDDKAGEEDIKEKNKSIIEPIDIEEGNRTRIEMELPAVDQDGRGVATTLVVEKIKNGSGRTLTDIENLLFWTDTQQSIRTARRIAENTTGIGAHNCDLIYSIDVNASVIGGPSAGAAITIATIGALTGRQPNNSVMITGEINYDGSIGPVSSILEKANASREAGAGLFLVPLLQSRDVVYRTEKHCERFGNTNVCKRETRPVKIDVGERLGINIKEVGTIREAQEYFF